MAGTSRRYDAAGAALDAGAGALGRLGQAQGKNDERIKELLYDELASMRARGLAGELDVRRSRGDHPPSFHTSEATAAQLAQSFNRGGTVSRGAARLSKGAFSPSDYRGSSADTSFKEWAATNDIDEYVAQGNSPESRSNSPEPSFTGAHGVSVKNPNGVQGRGVGCTPVTCSSSSATSIYGASSPRTRKRDSASFLNDPMAC